MIACKQDGNTRAYRKGCRMVMTILFTECLIARSLCGKRKKNRYVRLEMLIILTLWENFCRKGFYFLTLWLVLPHLWLPDFNISCSKVSTRLVNRGLGFRVKYNNDIVTISWLWSAMIGKGIHGFCHWIHRQSSFMAAGTSSFNLGPCCVVSKLIE